MPQITSQNVAHAIVQLIAVEAVQPLVSNLILGSLINRDYDQEVAQVGSVVNIPIPPVMATNNLAEGGSVTTQNPSLGNASVSLNYHREASFVIPDVVKAMDNRDLVQRYMTPAIIALAEDIESDILKTYPYFTANTVLGAAGVALDEDTIDSAETTLFKAKVPSGYPRYMVVSADAYSGIRKIPKFSEADKIADGGNNIRTGEVGRLKSFQIFRSQLVPVTSGSPNTTHNLAFTRDAIVLASRNLPQPLPGTGAVAAYGSFAGFGFRVTMSYNANTLAQQFTVDALYGVGPLRREFAVQVRS